MSRYKPFCGLVSRTLSGFIQVSLYFKSRCFYISLMFMDLDVRCMLGDPDGNHFIQCIAAHLQLWTPPSCTVTVNLSASPGRWSLGPLHGPRAQPLPVTRPSMLRPGVASPAPGSSCWQGPAQCEGCKCVGFKGLQYGKCCCGLFLLCCLPCPH